jgi:hypothetical protein
MGSFISAHKMFRNNDNYNNSKNKTICFICSEDIKEKQFTVCVRCEIGIHNICEESYRTNKYYTVCPRCDRCGSLANKVNV